MRTLAKYYGADRFEFSAAPRRMTFILDENGELIVQYTSGIDVGAHPQEVLEDCQIIFGE